ncbi:MAG: MFS transporter [Holosporales bacterium]|jgi:MFS family permease|nr:MFS transporter [Holosporales bacterium]
MESKISYRSWLVWGVAALFYLYELILRVSPSVMTNELMSTFNATSTTLGILVSFYYYAYTILQLPCGIILDKLGPRNLLGLSAILCVIGSVLFASYDTISVAQIGRFLVGAGSACAFISCLQISANLFPKKYFVILAGVTNMMGTIGGLLGGAPIAKAVNSIGWHNTTYALASIGIFIAILIFVFVPKRITKKAKSAIQEESIIQLVLNLMKNSQIVLCGVVGGLMYLPISAFSELWAVPFFMAKYGIRSQEAALASAILFIGVAIGSLVLAILARKINSYMKTIKMGALGAAVLFIPLLYCEFSLYAAFGFVFFIGFFTGVQVINFTCAQNNSTSEIAGTTIALINCIVMLIGSIFQPLLGLLLDISWNGKISEFGVRYYDISCYKYAIMTLPLCLLIACLFSLFIKETINKENE